MKTLQKFLQLVYQQCCFQQGITLQSFMQCNTTLGSKSSLSFALFIYSHKIGYILEKIVTIGLSGFKLSQNSCSKLISKRKGAENLLP